MEDPPNIQLEKPEVPSLIPARMLCEFAYCPRLAHLEWVEGQFQESADTLDGTSKHERVDTVSGELPPANDPTISDDAKSINIQKEAQSKATIHARSVMLSAPILGAIAKMDLVEGDGELVTPVDYKRGSLPNPEFGPYEPERVQLCIQALILRENGYKCNEGALYYVESKRRLTIAIDAALIARTLQLLDELRRASASGVIPPPLIDSPKCPRCSLVGICLPDEVNYLKRFIAKDGELVLASGKVAPEEPRRLLAASDDAIPLYVQEQGCVIGKTGEVLQVKQKGSVLAESRLFETSQVSIFGNVQISTQALQSLFAKEIPVCFFSYGGYFQGMATGLPHKNIDLRRTQYAFSSSAAASLRFASAFVEGKIRNCRTLLRRNAKEDVTDAIDSLDRFAESAKLAKSAESLLGIEGSAARIYFSKFATMLKRPEGGEPFIFDFDGRNRRPPKDPVNAMISYLYAVLTKDLTVTCFSVGFDPFLGFFHKPRYGRPALALDLLEEFRPLIADSVTIGMINSNEIEKKHFIQRGDACTLTPDGRRAILDAFERRMDTLVTHPVFGYSVSYRRILDIQARLLGRALAGEISAYPPFRTR